MDKILVPIQAKDVEIHEGHKQLIKYANTLGESIIQVSPPLQETQRYLAKGGELIDIRKNPLQKFRKSLVDVGAKKIQIPILEPISDEIRSEINHQVDSFMQVFDEYLIVPRYQMSMRVRLATTFFQAYSRGVNYEFGDVVLRGPELVSFAWKKIGPLIGQVPTMIFSNTIKSVPFKIREQTTLSRLDPKYYSYLPKFHEIYLETRPFLKAGSHKKLVQEINLSYSEVPWKVLDITTWEGGFVDGRIEVIGFTFPYSDPNGLEDQFGGTIIIEEGDYLC